MTWVNCIPVSKERLHDGGRTNPSDSSGNGQVLLHWGLECSNTQTTSCTTRCNAGRPRCIREQQKHLRERLGRTTDERQSLRCYPCLARHARGADATANSMSWCQSGEFSVGDKVSFWFLPISSVWWSWVARRRNPEGLSSSKETNKRQRLA